MAAPSYVGVGVECPAALFLFSAQPKPSIFGWACIANILFFINCELGQFALYHQHMILLSLPCLTSIIDIYTRYVLPIAHEYSYLHCTSTVQIEAARKTNSPSVATAIGTEGGSVNRCFKASVICIIANAG